MSSTDTSGNSESTGDSAAPTLESIEDSLRSVSNENILVSLEAAFKSWAWMGKISEHDVKGVLELLKDPNGTPKVGPLPARFPSTQLSLVLCVVTVVGTRLTKRLPIEDVINTTIKIMRKFWKRNSCFQQLLKAAALDHTIEFAPDVGTEPLGSLVISCAMSGAISQIRDVAPKWAVEYLDKDKGLTAVQVAELRLHEAYAKWSHGLVRCKDKATFSQRCFALWLGATIVHDPKCTDVNDLLKETDKAAHIASMSDCINRAITSQRTKIDKAVNLEQFEVFKFVLGLKEENVRDIVSRGSKASGGLWCGGCELYGIPLLYNKGTATHVSRLSALMTIGLHPNNADLRASFTSPGTNKENAPSALSFRRTKRPLPIVCGDSGSGKTLSALASCMMNGTGVAVYLLTTELHDKMLARELTRATNKKEYDDAVRKCVVDIVASFDIHPRARLETEYVVLVIDEAGDEAFVDIVRALCVCHEEICWSVGTSWLCTNVRMVVCGTGVEGATLTPGSPADTYRLINIADATTCDEFFKGPVCEALSKELMTTLVALLNPDRSQCPSSRLYPLLSKWSEEALARDPLLTSARRLLGNRRIAAALVSRLKSLRAMDAEINWHETLPVVMHYAVQTYLQLNAFSGVEWSERCGWGRLALALCLGGVQQAPPTGDNSLVRSRFGLVVDMAVMRDTRCAAAEFALGGECVLPRDPDDHLCHRFGISAAMYELVMCDFGVNAAGRSRCGVGLELTIADAVHVFLLGALRDDVTIAPLLSADWPPLTAAVETKRPRGEVDQSADGAVESLHKCRAKQTAASKLHDCLLRFACGTRKDRTRAMDVLFVTMVTPLNDVASCWRAAQSYATSVGSAPDAVIGAVLLNGPMAPYADVIGVVGRLGEDTPLRILLIQCKHVQKAISAKEVTREIQEMIPPATDPKATAERSSTTSTVTEAVVVQLVSNCKRASHTAHTLDGDAVTKVTSLVMDDDAIRMAIYPVPLRRRITADIGLSDETAAIDTRHCSFALCGNHLATHNPPGPVCLTSEEANKERRKNATKESTARFALRKRKQGKKEARMEGRKQPKKIRKYT